MPILRVTHRSSVLLGRELSFPQSVVRLGRDPECEVLFDEQADRSVSRNHAEIRWEASGPVLYPNSGKVVLIRNVPINVPTPLKSGDVLELAGPGGPSVEVTFDLAPQLGRASEVDAVAATVFEMNPSALGKPAEPSPPAVPVAPPPPPPAAKETPPQPAAPAPAERPAAVGLPEMPAPARPPPEQAGTAFIPALDAAALAQLDKKQAPVPVEVRSRRNLFVAAGAGVGVLVLAAGAAAWWSAREREERVRQAVQRVEALIDAQESSDVVPEVSEEDMRLFEEEVKANRHAPAPTELRTLRALKTRRKKAPKVAVVDSRPEEKPTEDLVPRREAARKAFAAYKRAKVERLAEGKPKDTTHLKALIAQEDAALAAYEEAAKQLAPGGDAIDALLRSTARQLGECDVLMPERLRTQARQFVEALKSDRTKNEALVAAMKRASQFHYVSPITAALAEEGLPPELFFIPVRMSGLEERRVELPTQQGIPKGMWALLPGPAKDLGLHVGKAKDSLESDTSDERQHYEREVKRVAHGMRLVFLKKAAGSSLLFMATWDHGDTTLLSQMKEKAGLEAQASDPEQVNFWKLWESGKLSDEVKSAALEYLALAAVSSKPELFGFSFSAPLENSAVAGKE